MAGFLQAQYTYHSHIGPEQHDITLWQSHAKHSTCGSLPSELHMHIPVSDFTLHRQSCTHFKMNFSGSKLTFIGKHTTVLVLAWFAGFPTWSVRASWFTKLWTAMCTRDESSHIQVFWI